METRTGSGYLPCLRTSTKWKWLPRSSITKAVSFTIWSEGLHAYMDVKRQDYQILERSMRAAVWESCPWTMYMCIALLPDGENYCNDLI